MQELGLSSLVRMVNCRVLYINQHYCKNWYCYFNVLILNTHIINRQNQGIVTNWCRTQTTIISGPTERRSCTTFLPTTVALLIETITNHWKFKTFGVSSLTLSWFPAIIRIFKCKWTCCSQSWPKILMESISQCFS